MAVAERFRRVVRAGVPVVPGGTVPGGDVGSLRGSGLGVVAGYVAYAAGMGTVVLLPAIAVVTARTSAVVKMRRAAPVTSRLSGLLVL